MILGAALYEEENIFLQTTMFRQKSTLNNISARKYLK